MDIGTAIIIMGLINIFGFMLILQGRDRAWFKREQWKLDSGNIKAENKLKLKKLEKDLGLTKQISTPLSTQELPKNLQLLKTFAPLIKSLDLDSNQIGEIIDRLLPPAEEGGSSESQIEEWLKHPIIEKIAGAAMDKLTEGQSVEAQVY